MSAGVGTGSSGGFYLRITDMAGKPFDDLEYLPAADLTSAEILDVGRN